jgi:hypothetical protein
MGQAFQNWQAKINKGNNNFNNDKTKNNKWINKQKASKLPTVLLVDCAFIVSMITILRALNCSKKSEGEVWIHRASLAPAHMPLTL